MPENLGLLDGAGGPTLEALERVVREVRLPKGTTIFAEGEPGDALYVVRSGLVDVVAHGVAGDTRLITLGPGETVGEQSLVTGQPRSATAVAQTGVTLWRLDHADFLTLLAMDPHIGVNVARIVSERLHAQSRGRLGLPRGKTVVLWSATPRVAATVAGPLAKACAVLLGERPVTFCCGPSDPWEGMRLPEGAEIRAADDLAGAAVRAVREHSMVLLLCSPEIPGPLLDGADRVIVLGDEVRAPERAGPVQVVAAKPTRDRVEALAREICGRRVALALGSGGIRGFAHAGVLAALADARIPLDLVSGASAGAIAGALYLSGMPPRDLANMPLAMREAVKTGMPTFSLSPQAILKGRRIHAYLRDHLGKDTRIEDLPVRFVVATTNLATREPWHIDRGNLADAVAASAAVPGVFPPVSIEGRRLVDGGVSDPVPVGALRERGADIVVAVNVMTVGKGPLGMYQPRFRLPMPGLVESLLIGFDTIVTQIAVHSCRQADVVVEPHGANARWYDLVPAAAYMKAGEHAMREALPQLRKLLGG